MPLGRLENQVELKLNGTFQLLVYADDVSLEMNAEKTKFMLLLCHQNAGQNHDVRTASISFEGMVNLIYLGMTVTN
jgi:hypothetical protein